MRSQVDEIKKYLKPWTDKLGISSHEMGMTLDTTYEFTEKEIRPKSMEWDKEGAKIEDGVCKLPTGMEDIYRRLGEEIGLTLLPVPETYGGDGKPILYTACIEILSGGEASIGVGSAVNATTIDMISKYGTEEAKEEYLPKLAMGKIYGSIALTEADAGSDLRACGTTSELVGDSYILNGSKIFITNGGFSGLYIVHTVDKEDEDTPPRERAKFNVFIVSKDTKGLEFVRNEEKLGWHTSPTTQLSFDNCVVPKNHLLGERFNGLKQYFWGLCGGRYNFGGAWSIGLLDAAYREALEYSKNRITFDKQIIYHPEISKKFVKIVRDISMGRQKYLYAAYLREVNDPLSVLEATVTKVFCTEAAVRGVLDLIRLFGCIGYTKECLLEKIYRDVYPAVIGEGATEVLVSEVIIDTIKKKNPINKGTATLPNFENFVQEYLDEDYFRQTLGKNRKRFVPQYEALSFQYDNEEKEVMIPKQLIESDVLDWKLYHIFT